MGCGEQQCPERIPNCWSTRNKCIVAHKCWRLPCLIVVTAYHRHIHVTPARRDWGWRHPSPCSRQTGKPLATRNESVVSRLSMFCGHLPPHL